MKVNVYFVEMLENKLVLVCRKLLNISLVCACVDQWNYINHQHDHHFPKTNTISRCLLLRYYPELITIKSGTISFFLLLPAQIAPLVKLKMLSCNKNGPHKPNGVSHSLCPWHCVKIIGPSCTPESKQTEIVKVLRNCMFHFRCAWLLVLQMP